MSARYHLTREAPRLITVADAQKVVTRKKQLVAPMGWARKLNHTEPAWYEYRSALEFADDPTETPEGLLIVCLWKRKDGPKPENWNFGLLYGGWRIYAIDVQPLAHHTNKVGNGRPLFGQRIRGNQIGRAHV